MRWKKNTHTHIVQSVIRSIDSVAKSSTPTTKNNNDIKLAAHSFTAIMLCAVCWWNMRAHERLRELRSQFVNVTSANVRRCAGRHAQIDTQTVSVKTTGRRQADPTHSDLKLCEGRARCQTIIISRRACQTYRECIVHNEQYISTISVLTAVVGYSTIGYKVRRDFNCILPTCGVISCRGTLSHRQAAKIRSQIVHIHIHIFKQRTYVTSLLWSLFMFQQH